MRTIVLASRKGGSGKTTLSGHLAVEADRTGGGPVAIIDTDPQGSLAAWWNERQSETPVFIDPAKFGSLAAALEQCRGNGIELVIIDTPPQATELIASVIVHADLVVIPTQPSPHDLRAVSSTVELAQRSGKRSVFVINGAAQRARITADAAVALSQHGAVAPVIIHQRTDFRTSMIDGRTVAELDESSRSAAEISTLWSFIVGRLDREDRYVESAITA
jgi:chromosome partitioning protein